MFWMMRSVYRLEDSVDDFSRRIGKLETRGNRWRLPRATGRGRALWEALWAAWGASGGCAAASLLRERRNACELRARAARALFEPRSS